MARRVDRSGVSICKSMFDQIIDIRECKQKNSKTFSVFIFSNFHHLPFFQRKKRLSKIYILPASALSFGENKTHNFYRKDWLLSLYTTLVINKQPLLCCNLNQHQDIHVLNLIKFSNNDTDRKSSTQQYTNQRLKRGFEKNGR